MIKKSFISIFIFLLLVNCLKASTSIIIDLDSVLTDVAHHPIGINVNFFMDGDGHFKPIRSTVEALKAMGVRYLRYPGGEKSDIYLWSVPPYDKPLPKMARTGKGAVRGRGTMLENYSTFKYDVLDFDEFMEMCREVGAEPVIVVAADEYLNDYPQGCTVTGRKTLIETAAAWVLYANIKKKYNVRYWMIGNETWHPNNPNETPEIYARDVIDFSKAMKAVDPSIQIFPNGNTFDWWNTIIPVVKDHIDGLCLSNYPVWDYKSGYMTYRDTLQDLMKPVDIAARAIEAFIPDTRKTDFKIIVAEYGPFDWAGTWPHVNDMGHALANFEMIGEQLKHPKILFSLFWNTRWIKNLITPNEVWDALDKEGHLNPTGYAVAIWGNFLASHMVYTSSTLKIRTYASYDNDKKQLFVYIINKSEFDEEASLNLGGGTVDSVTQRWELVGTDHNDTTPVWRKTEIKLLSNPLVLIVPGISITVIEYQLR